MYQMKMSDPLQHILENLNTAVLLFDNGLQLKYINPAGEILLAVSARHIIGQTVDALWSRAAEFSTALRQSYESGRPYTEREVQLTLSNMQTITVDCTVTPLGDSHHGKELLLELLPMDRHLRIAREENLLALSNTTRALLRGMAHEIKNPLGGLRGAAQLLEKELPSDDLKEYTQIIISEADRLQNLLDRMLGPNALPKKRMINIHQVVERVYTLIKAEAPDDVTITRDYDPSIPDLYADDEQLIQALLNIARNALQALNGHGDIIFRSRAQRHFTIGHKYHKLVARIDVIDNGAGIHTDMLEEIFYPMVTGRPEGTGLGLPIAQSLVNLHGGLIECASQPGETTFSLIIPLERNNEH